MFLTRRPSQLELDEFVNQSRNLPLSYDPVGIAKQSPNGFNIDQSSAVIGQGDQAFERAKTALAAWRHFELGCGEIEDFFQRLIRVSHIHHDAASPLANLSSLR